ncbi:MAG: transketolase [Deltaproteobacteria bacterium]|nr:transketolase [Deltaproteobacteria bacterium]
MNKIDKLSINTIRSLSIDAVQKANSGHPGAPMGLAPAAYTLWTKILKHNPSNPKWFDRDRFILSGGHASALLYSLLFLTGYNLTIEDIKRFRQWGSKTPGHPEYGDTPGVETTTGPLGQGFANAIGIAIAERHLAATFNKKNIEIINHYTYVITGDGDMMEGIVSEAASLAGHLGLGKLITIYDSNNISIEGNTNITFTEDVGKRFEAYGWQILKIKDGDNDIEAIEKALTNAKKEKNRPTLIILKTNIAFGSPNKQNTADAHGAPLGEEEIILTKKNLGCPNATPFYIPEEAFKHCRKSIAKGEKAEAEWLKKYNLFCQKHPREAEKLNNAINLNLPENFDNILPRFSASEAPIATRAASGKILNTIAKQIPYLMGGSADLAPSNKTFLQDEQEFQKQSYNGKNIRFGVREHAMGAITTGITLHGGIRSYTGTFLVFADYMRPSIRLASLMKQPTIYIFTHDSVAVGEDGPTHQPVEHIASLRLIPNLIVIRPADAAETKQAWSFIMKNTNAPTALILSRQKLPVIDRSKYASETNLNKGAYILADTDKKPDIILMASGAEVHLAIEAKKILEQKNLSVRVVSFPSFEIFEKQDNEYKEKVLPKNIKARLSIEAGINTGWHEYTTDNGASLSIETFGASAPGNTVLKQFGFTVENVVAKALELLN